MVFPAVTASDFDYSPIYELPNIKWLQCETIYGADEEKVCSIDYSNFRNLKRLGISGSKGHLNVHKAETVESLFFDFGFPSSKTLSGFLPKKNLVNLTVRQSPIHSLEGIEGALKVRRLELAYNRRLTDISALHFLRETLTYLEIDTCGKIRDFSVLRELHNLEFLELKDFAKKEFGSDYSSVEFHRALLDIGPAPFSIVEKYLEKFYSPQT
jgi:hypothetical protein